MSSAEPSYLKALRTLFKYREAQTAKGFFYIGGFEQRVFYDWRFDAREVVVQETFPFQCACPDLFKNEEIAVMARETLGELLDKPYAYATWIAYSLRLPLHGEYELGSLLYIDPLIGVGRTTVDVIKLYRTDNSEEKQCYNRQYLTTLPVDTWAINVSGGQNQWKELFHNNLVSTA